MDDTNYLGNSDTLTGAPDIGSDAAPAVDPSIGASAGPTAPSAAGVTPDGRPTMGADPAFTPNGPPTGLNAAGNTYTTPGSSAPPPVGVKGLGATLIQGMLWGLAGSKGSTSFGGGLAGGAQGYMVGKQQQVTNAQNQQQLQMESMRAADTHITALDEHKRADQLSTEAKLDYKQKSATYQAFLQNNFGVEPNLEFADNNSEATAGLQTLANSNAGGTIPPVSALHQPETQGTEGKVAVFSPTQTQMRQNAQGFRNLYNTQRQIQGLPDIDDASWNSMGFKGQRDGAQGAIEFLKPTPTFNLDKNSPLYLPNVLAQKKQQLQTYEQSKDANGKSNAKPNVEAQLSQGISFLQSSWDNSNSMENKAAAAAVTATAPAKADAAAQEDLAKQNTPQGQATLQKTQAETAKAQQDLQMNSDILNRTDGFGNKLGLVGDTGKDVKSKTNAFQKSYVQPLDQLAKTKSEFDRITANPNMTPAEKVTGLLAAVGISFDPLKGKGARMTQSVIGEHQDARSIYGTAEAKLNALVPSGGGPITPGQVKDYAAIANGVVHDAYVMASWRAQEQGLDSTSFLPRANMNPDGSKPTVGGDTAKIYLDAAHGDKNKAHAALQTNGYAN